MTEPIVVVELAAGWAAGQYQEQYPADGPQ